ncbi:hypothetical protein BLOT_016868 [Blomia tropicalis]|nr:hypothetical protein BLOT_016868 [Blomia tropicalis]
MVFAEFLTKAKLVNLNDFIKPVLESYEMIIGSNIMSKSNNNTIQPSNETANSDKRNIVFEFDTNPSDISEICSIGVCQNGYICLLIKKRINEYNYRLQVFETKYNTMISEFNLTEPILKENSLKVINNSVLVTCKNNVRVFPILKRKLFLSQLVTKDLDESVKIN